MFPFYRKDMKVKLLRKVIARARFCAHINSVTTERLWNGKERVVGVSVGYGVADYKPNQVWRFGMTEEMFYRKVRQVYWQLNKRSYRRNYKR